METNVIAVVSPEEREELLAEYDKRSDEIALRMPLRQRTLHFAVVVLGVILTLGSQTAVSPLVLLLYPILAVFLAVDWAQYDIRIGTLGAYIEASIESKLPGLNWQKQHIWDHEIALGTRRLRLTEMSAIGVFVVADVVTVSLAISRINQVGMVGPFVGLVLVDMVAMVVAIWIIRQRRRAYKEVRKALGMSDAITR